MKIGYTTGTFASAAAKAAVKALFSGIFSDRVTVALPDSKRVDIQVIKVTLLEGRAVAKTVKNWSNDPDVTRGVEIFAEAEETVEGIKLKAGDGIGIVTKPGLRVPIGEPAINPVPRKMIIKAIEEALPSGRGVEITLSIPRGKELAEKTLNPKLGIAGGISILGTTGVVTPWSEKAYRESILPQVDVALAEGFTEVILTPGNLGFVLAMKKGIPEDAIIKVGNYFDFMIEKCREKGVEKILLLGYVGKLMKLSAGIFNTHSKVADAKFEILAANACLEGASREEVMGIMTSSNIQEAINLLEHDLKNRILKRIAEKVSEKVEERFKIETGTVLTSMTEEILSWDEKAGRIKWAEYLL